MKFDRDLGRRYYGLKLIMMTDRWRTPEVCQWAKNTYLWIICGYFKRIYNVKVILKQLKRKTYVTLSWRFLNNYSSRISNRQQFFWPVSMQVQDDLKCCWNSSIQNIGYTSKEIWDQHLFHKSLQWAQKTAKEGLIARVYIFSNNLLTFHPTSNNRIILTN